MPFGKPLRVAETSLGGQVIAVGIHRQRLVRIAPVVVEVCAAGLEIALQAFYVPTGGPLGFDLSNGIWARLGY